MNQTDKIFDEDELEEEEESLGLYAVKLKDFEGPFDMLCHLIKKSKYSIEDVKISEITEQYMEYMGEIDQLDLEKATEFVTMAAWLLEIKSKSLLPQPQEVLEEEDDPEKRLKQQLAEYSLFKEASIKMKDIETVDILYRAPDDSVGRPTFLLKDMNSEGLLSALSKMFLKMEQRAEEIRDRHIVKDSFTVEEKIAYIKDRLEIAENINFFDLFGGFFAKHEVITTFLALLELLKAQYLVAVQPEIYGDIFLKRAAVQPEDLTEDLSEGLNSDDNYFSVDDGDDDEDDDDDDDDYDVADDDDDYDSDDDDDDDDEDEDEDDDDDDDDD